MLGHLRDIELGERPEHFREMRGAAGWLAYPFFLLFELLGPVVEVLGYVIMVVAWFFGLLSLESFLVFPDRLAARARDRLGDDDAVALAGRRETVDALTPDRSIGS